MTSTANVATYVPPPPPGPATYNRAGFRNGGTLLVDAGQLAINANTVNTCRLRAYGDPANPLAPTISAPSIATNILFAPGFDTSNNVQFRAAMTLSNSMVQLINPLVVTGNVTVGAPFNWKPPSFGILSRQPLALAGGSLGQTYPLSGGQVRGYAILYVPQPPIATGGQLYDLNGGTVTGGATLYH